MKLCVRMVQKGSAHRDFQCPPQPNRGIESPAVPSVDKFYTRELAANLMNGLQIRKDLILLCWKANREVSHSLRFPQCTGRIRRNNACFAQAGGPRLQQVDKIRFRPETFTLGH